jgi:hypothetical protein
MVVKYVYQDFPSIDPPKFTQIGIFGLKTNHLATLLTVVNDGKQWSLGQLAISDGRKVHTIKFKMAVRRLTAIRCNVKIDP